MASPTAERPARAGRLLRLAILALAAGALLGAPALAAATPPGANGAIAFVRDGDVWTVAPDGGDPVQVTSGPEVDSGPAWSPDGATIAFARRSAEAGPADIWLVRPGSAPERLTDTALFGEDSPAWAPDGARITFARACQPKVSPDPGCAPYDAMRTSLVARRLDGPDEYVVARYGGRSSWSPDGNRIVLDSNFDNGPLVLVRPDGTGLVPFPGSDQRPGEVDLMPSWSPDGGSVAYARVRSGGTGVSVIRADGTGLTHLVPASEGAGGLDPAWSPDGRRIAFARPGDPDVWVMDADGSGRRPLGVGSGDSRPEPDWQPLPAEEPASGVRALVDRVAALRMTSRLGSSARSNASIARSETVRWSFAATTIWSGVGETHWM